MILSIAVTTSNITIDIAQNFVGMGMHLCSIVFF